jgi:hypothetical protein
MPLDPTFFNDVHFMTVEMEAKGQKLVGTVPNAQRDTTRIMGVFPVDIEQAQALLPPHVSNSATFWLDGNLAPKNKALLSVFISENREVANLDLADLPLMQVDLMMGAVYQGLKCFWVYYVLTSSQEAAEKINLTWDHATHLCEITLEDSETACAGMVHADGQHVLTLSVPKGPPREMVADVDILSVADDGSIRVAHCRTQGDASITADPGVELTLGDHALVAPLKDLNVGSPILGAYFPQLQYWLDNPRIPRDSAES